MNTIVKLSISGLLAVVTAVLIFFWLQSVRVESEASVAVYVARADLVADGSTFSATTVEAKSLPASVAGGLTNIAVPVAGQTMALLDGQTFVRDVPQGGVILWEYLREKPEGELSSKLAAGKRALTIPVNAPATVGYFVEPGSLVDVLGTVMQAAPSDGTAVNQPAQYRVATLTLLQAVRVLAVGRAADSEAFRRNAGGSYSTVTIEVSPEEAEMVVFAMQQVQSGLTLVLRNPDDAARVDTPSVNWQNWIGASPALGSP